MENLVEADGLRLRRAVKEDVKRLWEICRGQTAEEFCLWGADLVYEYPPRLEQMRRRFEALSGDAVLFAAECSGQVVGFAEIGELDPAEKCGVLARVLLEKGRRGKGRGKELVNLVLDQAAGTLGLEEVKLIVYAGNLRAQRCYEACGFVRGKALLRPGRPDAWWMRVDLRERRGGSQPSQRLKGV